ncbi:sensor histidine kinase [Burkholderia oklahomensis]|uniref:sensor histidine kinase n=2 Tax=Burkholderia oklahomensis TaxID=342113 RepID=UPI0005DA5A9E|nr:HAMP domain-containing sensor histidine kinase [Burkholderia oklahomensis]AJX35561.1 his Kinase A domain protein [Burkholderia oklahomensis C6786]AOI48345.1 histidine kinase [Burkholderia oklahomensis C6786]KUY52512.1 histidine kinase [Burkholderia oklahomensis C6786]MBI0363503.1 HAMP domain-containing histidine kinase [Burkholderia oklahomensis]SUY27624.1 Sensor histidine kinase YycG [Burkholderia oklahomensis]
MTPSAVDPAAALLRERAARFAAEVALFVRDHALSVASHDLRSPLNAMHSWAYVLERRLAPGDDNLQRALAGIRIGIEQQTSLLETVVDAPRAETRTLPIARAGVALAPLADACAALARAALGDARGTAVTVAPLAQPGASLDCDRERVAQALWSMLTFAIEASAPGSEVALRCDAAADATRFDVTFRAQPSALTDAALPHVFETFARRDALAERQGGRPASVFALAQRVARAHGGRFAQGPLADGAPSTLTLTIPAARA